MKNLTLIIHHQARQTLADYLRSLPQVAGFTLSMVEGHSRQNDEDPALSARDKVVGYVPRTRVDVLLNAGDVTPLLEQLRQLRDLQGKTHYWVTEVEVEGRF